jgi:O-antigen/teichoic acid export membrane protein
MSILKSSVQTLFSKLLTLVLGMLCSVLIVKLVGAEGKGSLSLFYAFFGIMISVLILSLGNGIIYYLNKGYKKNLIISTSLVLGGIISIVIALVIVVFYEMILSYLGDNSFALIILGVLFSIFTVFERILDAINVGIKASKLFNSLQITRQIIYSILVISAFFLNDVINYKWILTFTIFSVILKIGLNSFKLFKKKLIEFNYSKIISHKILNFSLKAHFGVIIQKMNTKFDLLIVGFLLTPKEIGIYSIALLFSEFIWLIPDSIGVFLFPHLSQGNNHSKKANTTARINRILIPIVGFLMIFIPTVCIYIIPLLYGNEFKESITPLYILCIASFFFSISKIITKYFSGIGKPMINSRGSFIVFVINCFLTYFLTFHYGMIGASISCVVSYLFLLIFYCKMFVKLNEDISIKHLFFINKTDLLYIKKIILR